MLFSYLQKITDFRRKQSQHFPLAEVLMVVIIGVVGGSKSYRELESYIKSYFEELKNLLNLKWARVPNYSTIRNIMIGIDSEELENALRLYTKALLNHIDSKYEETGLSGVGIDGKTMRGSFDNFKNQKAFHILSTYLNEEQIVLGHEVVEVEKTNEIPMAQKLIRNLGLTGVVYTLDALHCQKKL